MTDTSTPRTSTLAAPASVGLVAGFGLYVSLRILGERLMAAPLVPVLWWISLFAFAAAPGRAVAAWRTRSAPLVLALVVLAAVLADLAHVFYVPFPTSEGPAPFKPVHRHGAELVVLLVALPVPFARAGRRLGELVAGVADPLRALAIALGAAGVGLALGVVAVLAIGGYEAFVAWLVAVALSMVPRRAAVAVLVVCVGVAAWVRVKPQAFLGAAAEVAWGARGWSADQKLDRLGDGACVSWAANNVVLGGPCPAPGTAPTGTSALLGEIGARLAPRDVLYLASALPRRPAEIAAALAASSHVTVVSAEARVVAPPDDSRLTIVADDPRHFVEANDAPADLVWIDGVDVPLVASVFFPVPRASWLLTEQGWRALLSRTGESGVVVVERSQATAEDFARLTRALPADVKWVAAECTGSLMPAAALPCAWIALSRSDATLASVREAFAATAGARLLEVAAAPPPRVATDDRPIVIFPEKLYAVETGGALVVIAALALLRRRRGDTANVPARRGLRLASAGLALMQVAIAVSLGRASASPGLSIALLWALGWLALGGALWLFAGRTPRAPRPAPFAFATASVAGALAASLAAIAVASPFANRGLAIPLVVLAAAPAGALIARSWAATLTSASPGALAAAAGAVLTGYALGLALAPGLVAADGFSFAALVGAVAMLAAAWPGPLSRRGT